MKKIKEKKTRKVTKADLEKAVINNINTIHALEVEVLRLKGRMNVSDRLFLNMMLLLPELRKVSKTSKEQYDEVVISVNDINAAMEKFGLEIDEAIS